MYDRVNRNLNTTSAPSFNRSVFPIVDSGGFLHINKEDPATSGTSKFPITSGAMWPSGEANFQTFDHTSSPLEYPDQLTKAMSSGTLQNQPSTSGHLFVGDQLFSDLSNASGTKVEADKRNIVDVFNPYIHYIPRDGANATQGAIGRATPQELPFYVKYNDKYESPSLLFDKYKNIYVELSASGEVQT